MRGVRLSLAVIAAAALVAVAAGAGRASFPGTNGRLFFIASHHVYSIAEDGTGLAQVTSGSANDLAVASSPDGRRLVVERDTGDQCGHLFWRAGYELFLVNPDG